jgi:serpin B
MHGYFPRTVVVDAFDKNKADFSKMNGINNSLYIDKFFHKAFVEVNEDGTEAYSISDMIENQTSKLGLPKPGIFRTDHPFLFLIQEEQTGSILFMGRMTDPINSGNQGNKELGGRL